MIERHAALSLLAARLQAAAFGADALRDLLGVAYPDDVGLLNRAPALERIRDHTAPSAVLARLLYLEADEPLRTVRAVLTRDECARLIAAKLLSRRGTAVHARLRLDCVGGLLLLADRRFRAVDPRALGLPAGDMVYPPGADSALLAQIAARLRGNRVLDLCTGSGVLGLTVAAASEQVTAVDINPRAVALATSNAVLNGIANFRAAVSNLYTVVAGSQFDLILANPPFVPGPLRGPSYHSGGPRGDRVLRRVVAGLGQHLSPAGRAVIISHLALRQGEDVAAAVQPWLGQFRGRVLILRLESGTPVDLAAAQSLFALSGGFAAYAREVRQWVAYLRRHRVVDIALIVLVAESGAARPLEVVQALQRTLPLPLSRPAAELVQEWLGLC